MMNSATSESVLRIRSPEFLPFFPWGLGLAKELQSSSEEEFDESMYECSILEKTMYRMKLESEKRKKPSQKLTMLYWNVRSVMIYVSKEKIDDYMLKYLGKRKILYEADSDLICLGEPFHAPEIPGYKTIEGKCLDQKTKRYTSISFRKELKV